MPTELAWPKPLAAALSAVRSHPRDAKARSRFVDEAAQLGRSEEALRALEELAHELTSAGQQHVAEELLEHMAAMKLALDLDAQAPQPGSSSGGAPIGMPNLFGDDS